MEKRFKICEVTHKEELDCYIAVRKNLFGKEIAEIVNLDIDSKGGLRIIHSGKKFDLNQVGLQVNEIPELENVGEFIQVEVYNNSLFESDILTVSSQISKIFENKYLKLKNKFVLVDGIVYEVKFKDIYTHPLYDQYIYHNYQIIK